MRLVLLAAGLGVMAASPPAALPPISRSARSIDACLRAHEELRASLGDLFPEVRVPGTLPDCQTRDVVPPSQGSSAASATEAGSLSLGHIGRPGELDVTVGTTGLTRIAAETVRSFWTGPIVAAELALFSREGPVALHIDDTDGDGLLGPGEGIAFYGEAGRSRYSRTKVYRLAREGLAESILRMPKILAPLPSTPGQAGALPTERRFEENGLYTVVLRNGEKENFFWTRMSRSSSASVVLDLPGLSVSTSGSAVLTLDLQGLTAFDAANPDHHARVTLNGQTVADVVFDGQTEQQAAIPVPLSLLLPAGNAIGLSIPADNAAPYDYVLLDRISVDYARDLAPHGEASYRLDAPGDAVLALGPFGAPGEVVVLDLTDPLRPRRQTVAPAPNGSGGWVGTSSFFGLPGTVIPLLVAPSPSVPLSVAPSRGATLLGDRRGADLVIVSPPEFLDPARRLAEAREGEGLRVRVVRTDDLYGAFSGGELSPLSIRDLLVFAVAEWSPPAPRYVLLLGDGSYDYRGDLDGGILDVNRTFVPAALYDSEFGETASDNFFVDFDGGHLPELAIGRIPAASLAEADSAVDKILAYRDRPFDVGFATKALFVADDAAEAWEQYYFEDLSETLRGELPPYMDSQAVYLSQLGAATPQEVLDGINEGAVFVNYLGHGSVRSWATEQIFGVSSVASLTNVQRPTFVSVLSCANGAFQNPNVGYGGVDQRSLGEALLLSPSGGAVAVWGSTTNVYPDAFPSVASAALRAALGGEVLRVGDVLVHGKEAADPGAEGVVDVLEGMTLLGDPSMVLRNNHTPAAVAEVAAATATGGWTPLDGSASSDPDGQSLRYRWSIVSAPADSEARIATPDARVTRLWPDLAGDYLVRLEVSDGFEWSAPTESTLSASGPDSPPPGSPSYPGCGCALGKRSRPTGAILSVLLLAAVLAWRRKKDASHS